MKLLLTIFILFVTGCGSAVIDTMTDCDTGNVIIFSVDRGVGAYCLGSTKMSVLEDGSYQCYWPCAKSIRAPSPERCQSITVTFTSGSRSDSIFEFSGSC